MPVFSNWTEELLSADECVSLHSESDSSVTTETSALMCSSNMRVVQPTDPENSLSHLANVAFPLQTQSVGSLQQGKKSFQTPAAAAAHLMTKSVSLLAMVTTTSGTLYGVSRWLSMVALQEQQSAAVSGRGRPLATERFCYRKCRESSLTSWRSWAARAGCSQGAAGWRGSGQPHARWSSLGVSSHTGVHTGAWGNTAGQHLACQHRQSRAAPNTTQCSRWSIKYTQGGQLPWKTERGSSRVTQVHNQPSIRWDVKGPVCKSFKKPGSNGLENYISLISL